MKRLLKNFWKRQKRLQIAIRMVRNWGFHKNNLHFMMLLQNQSISRIFIRVMNWFLWQENLQKCFVRIARSIGRRKKQQERRCVRWLSDSLRSINILSLIHIYLYVVGWGSAAHIGGQVDAEEALPACSGVTHSFPGSQNGRWDLKTGLSNAWSWASDYHCNP